MTHKLNTEHVLALAVIIREVNGGQRLGAAALAEAILAHPGSRWESAQSADTSGYGQILSPEPGYEQIPDDGDPEKLPRDAQQVDGKWWEPRYGCDSLAKVLEAARIELDPDGKNGSLILDYLQQVATLPTAWPDLPEEPPATTERGSVRQMGYREGWQAARAELQRQRGQAGAAPTPAPAFPEISDQLIKMLIVDILAVAVMATEESCLGRYWHPVPEARARLCEILQLAAQDEAARRPTR